MNDYKGLSKDWGSKTRKADSRAAKSKLRKVSTKTPPVRYHADDYAAIWGVPVLKPLRAKFKEDMVEVFDGRKKVFDCNKTFFWAHFELWEEM